MSDLQCPARLVVVRSDAAADLVDGWRAAGVVMAAEVVRAARADDLDAIADLHRGETVVVVHDGSLDAVLGEGPIVLDVDADGWRRVPSVGDR